MNIFHVSDCPYTAAEMLCDKHVGKMLMEAVQMLCTAHHTHGSWHDKLMWPAYIHHPMTKWVAKTRGNYLWALEHAYGLRDEFMLRYGKTHRSGQRLYDLPSSASIPADTMTPPEQCMPTQYKDVDHVLAYRNYYIGEKARFAKWEKGREMPEWYAVGIKLNAESHSGTRPIGADQ